MSNVGGAGVLAADACTDLGLAVHQPHGLTRRRLRALLPGGTVTGPVDTAAAISAEDFRHCLELLAAGDDVDAMIVLVLPTGATGDLIQAIEDADVRVPLAVVAIGQPESVRLIQRSADDTRIPVYGYPEAAAAALARAARYGAWCTEPRGQVPSFPDVRAADARALVTGFLHREPDGGWLPADQTADLLRCYGIWPGRADPGRQRRRGGPGRRGAGRPGGAQGRGTGPRRTRPTPARWNSTCTPRPKSAPPTAGWPPGSAPGCSGSSCSRWSPTAPRS